ncbi:MAG: WbqC family protein, partial [bacterium]
MEELKAKGTRQKGKGKKIAILQSNYIPWKGYFDIINYVDEFIVYDDAQYTRRDWRNRNLIKTPRGLKWLTIPVEVKGKYTQTIYETKIADKNWAEKHWKSIRHNYNEADCFEEFR